jgi:hypothetical protein
MDGANKLLIANKVTTHFVRSPCTSTPRALFRDSILGIGLNLLSEVAADELCLWKMLLNFHCDGLDQTRFRFY